MEITQKNLNNTYEYYEFEDKKYTILFRLKRDTDTSSLHLSFAYVSSPISESIYISPLIATIKKNKIISLIFNVRLNIFTNFSSSILTPTSLHLYCHINSF